ncbi:MAG: YbaB/EbfC family nucleoid-associated protein [Erysipelotrichaceae bacterium]|nr:YbaB/EbfC family nucleoid-associated protein [Erysipelotrichaceae bacterium]
MDFNKLLEQAQQMQKDLERMNEEMNAALFEGSASNGLVKVTISGDNEVKEVFLDPSVVDPSDKEMLEDMIMIAFNDAKKKADAARNSRLSAAAGGLQIPGL